MTPTTIDRPARRKLEPDEKLSLVRTLGFVLFLHVVGWGLLIGVVAPHDYEVGGKVLGVGLGLTAYTLGMRHAFDADHIAAIDNTTRKLMADGKRPMSVGFWFSLGHSSVVFVMVLAIAFGVRALARGIDNDNSSLQQITGVWGTSISGAFLLLIGLINLAALIGIVQVFRQLKHGQYDEAELERQLDKRGFLNRILGKVTKAVKKPWHMYPDRLPVRPRLRHRLRDRPAGDRRRGGRREPPVVGGAHPADPLRRRACRCSTLSTERS